MVGANDSFCFNIFIESNDSHTLTSNETKKTNEMKCSTGNLYKKEIKAWK